MDLVSRRACRVKQRRVSTKEKILLESRIYFNQQGYGASSLYQISQQLGMSRGNLTYHFKDKETLMDAHLAQLEMAYDQALTSSVSIPSWQSLHAATSKFHQLQKDYAFIFFDKSVLQLEKTQTLIKKLRDNNIKTQMSMINLSIQMGNMRPEIIPGLYHNISRSYWVLSYFWLLTVTFSDDNDVSWDKIMWSMLLPHFTEQGVASFKEHFGEAYFGTLGKAYEAYMESSMVGF